MFCQNDSRHDKMEFRLDQLIYDFDKLVLASNDQGQTQITHSVDLQKLKVDAEEIKGRVKAHDIFKIQLTDHLEQNVPFQIAGLAF